MKKELILKLLVLCFVIEIIGELISALYDVPYLVFIFKPFLMPLLAYWYIKSTTKPSKILLYALFFSWFGDVFLMFVAVNPNFFLAGLVSFLTTHLLYIVIFVKNIDTSKKSILKRRPQFILLFVLYGLSLLAFLNQTAHPAFLPMKIPVAVYATVIMLMVVTAIGRFERVNQKSFSLVLVGALLFMFSDTFIALNKFTYILENQAYAARIFIMLMYVLGQYLIVKGLLEQEAEN